MQPESYLLEIQTDVGSISFFTNPLFNTPLFALFAHFGCWNQFWLFLLLFLQFFSILIVNLLDSIITCRHEIKDILFDDALSVLPSWRWIVIFCWHTKKYSFQMKFDEFWTSLIPRSHRLRQSNRKVFWSIRRRRHNYVFSLSRWLISIELVPNRANVIGKIFFLFK